MRSNESKKPIVLLKGVISNLERSRRSHDFVLTEIQQKQMGATAVAASAMGMGAAAIGLVSMAGNADEEADWVEFELDGRRVTGWLWMMPMRSGDAVEVVAEDMGGGIMWHMRSSATAMTCSLYIRTPQQAEKCIIEGHQGLDRIFFGGLFDYIYNGAFAKRLGGFC